ncbi:hypothetical protein A1D31_14140 [Bradyrhizobium liaoningense]|nr:hypothetical protein A1D31_14140 [Bradyrhizobium liaoningense]
MSHKIATARRVPTAFGVFWTSPTGLVVPCEAYTLDANGVATSGDDATPETLAGAYERGETFLTYEGWINEDTAKKSAAVNGDVYSVRPLPAGTYFYDHDELCVVAPAEPAKVEASAHTPGPWRAVLARTLIHIQGNSPVCSISIAPPRIPERELREQAVSEARANATLIAAAPDMLAELRRLFELCGHQATADVIKKATGQ